MSNQQGYIFEKSNAFHIRYYLYTVKGKRIQRSTKLCDKNDNTPSTDSFEVQRLAAKLMQGVNAAVASERSSGGHCCPVCNSRCRRTVEGKFTKGKESHEPNQH